MNEIGGARTFFVTLWLLGGASKTMGWRGYVLDWLRSNEREMDQVLTILPRRGAACLAGESWAEASAVRDSLGWYSETRERIVSRRAGKSREWSFSEMRV